MEMNANNIKLSSQFFSPSMATSNTCPLLQILDDKTNTSKFDLLGSNHIQLPIINQIVQIYSNQFQKRCNNLFKIAYSSTLLTYCFHNYPEHRNAFTIWLKQSYIDSYNINFKLNKNKKPLCIVLGKMLSHLGHLNQHDELYLLQRLGICNAKHERNLSTSLSRQHL